MPTYQYKCPECECIKESENYRDDSLFCECNGTKNQMMRVYGFSGAVFKGSGFAKTDSRTHKRETII